MSIESVENAGAEEPQPEHLVEVLIQFFTIQSVLTMDVMAGRRDSPPDFLTRLEEIQTARRLLASNRQTPAHLLRSFSKVDDFETLLALIQNPATPQGIVAQVLENASFQVKCMLAGSSGTPLFVRRTLANDPDDEVRWILAENAWVGDEILEVLSRNSGHSVEVISNLLRNPNVPREVLAQIEASEDDERLKKIAKLLLDIHDLRAEMVQEEESEA